MGANLARFCGSIFRLPTTDRIALFASGAGAGLAVAFNAPIAGAVFVLEELVLSISYSDCHRRTGHLLFGHRGSITIARAAT